MSSSSSGSKDPEDLELEALQRRLDNAFETTRPRRGFEDELWLRIQRRRPFPERVRDLVGGFVESLWEVPAIPIAAVALLLIVFVGVGVLSSGVGLFAHRGESISAGSGAVPKGDMYAPGGRVPTPALHPGVVPQAPSNASGPGLPVPLAAPANVYYGPANLVWTGTFPSGSVSAPVLIYAEPTPDQTRSASNSFGAQEGVTFQTRGSVPELPREPTYYMTELTPGVSAGTDPVTAASAFLSAHNLLPPWPDNVVVVQAPGVTRVIFQRAFSLPGGDNAFLVDGNGERYGIEVDIAGGRRTAIGPLPLGLQSVPLALISNVDAARLAVSEPPASQAAITPAPSVQLDHVELVYALAIAGGNGFYEPAYLFSGSFTYNGQTYVKRVLVPLVVPELRS